MPLVSSVSPADLPLSTYEVYLLGKGTAEDRAWIFVNCLRQLNLDAVLLVPKPVGDETAGADAAPYWWCAGFDGKIYLFDPLAGIAVPSLAKEEGGESTWPGVATLAEAVADPAVLKQLDSADTPYPIRAADLERPGVAIVGETSLWSPRMQALQTEFTGSRAWSSPTRWRTVRRVWPACGRACSRQETSGGAPRRVSLGLPGEAVGRPC